MADALTRQDGDAVERPLPSSWHAACQARWELLLPHRQRTLAAVRRRFPELDAEDIVHDALLRVFAMPDLDEARLGGLVLTVAQRLAIDEYRRRGREHRAVSRAVMPPPVAPDELALDNEEASRLWRRLASLSGRERNAILGRAAGYPPHETAASLGVPPKSLHLALSRARTALKAAAGGAPLIVLWRRLLRGTRRVLKPALLGSSLALAVVALHSTWQLPATVHLEPARLSAAAAPIRAVHGDHSAMGWSSHQAQAHAGAPATRPAGLSPSAGGASGQVAGVAVGRRDLVSGSVTVSRKNQQESFLQSLEACLQPGAISLNPHHAGCSR